MLADVGDDNAVLGQTTEEFVEEADGWLSQTAGIEFRTIFTASNVFGGLSCGSVKPKSDAFSE